MGGDWIRKLTYQRYNSKREPEALINERLCFVSFFVKHDSHAHALESTIETAPKAKTPYNILLICSPFLRGISVFCQKIMKVALLLAGSIKGLTWECDNGQQIVTEVSLRCNGLTDCDDGSDEESCLKCNSNQFQCPVDGEVLCIRFF